MTEVKKNSPTVQKSGGKKGNENNAINSYENVSEEVQASSNTAASSHMQKDTVPTTEVELFLGTFQPLRAPHQE